MSCYGRTVSGTPCELPEGHYPATHHQIRMGTSWMAWTDESMAEGNGPELAYELDDHARGRAQQSYWASLGLL